MRLSATSALPLLSDYCKRPPLSLELLYSESFVVQQLSQYSNQNIATSLHTWRKTMILKNKRQGFKASSRSLSSTFSSLILTDTQLITRDAPGFHTSCTCCGTSLLIYRTAKGTVLYIRINYTIQFFSLISLRAESISMRIIFHSRTQIRICL